MVTVLITLIIEIKSAKPVKGLFLNILLGVFKICEFISVLLWQILLLFPMQASRGLQLFLMDPFPPKKTAQFPF